METSLNSYKSCLKELLILAFPMFIGCMGHTLIGAGDIFVLAKYDIQALAAASIANSLLFTVMIFGLGILIAVSIILSKMRGEKQPVKKYLPSVLLLSIVISVIFSFICFFSRLIVPYFGLESKMVSDIQEYLSFASFSLAGVYLYEGIKQFLQAYEIVKFPNYLSLVTVVLNLAVNIILVFGFWFIPSMGLRGAAIATLLVRLSAGAVMVMYIYRFINLKYGIDFKMIKNIIKTGLPIGAALLFEFAAFNIINILAGMESGLLAAVHSILITIANTSFMAPFAISSALSIKAAYWFGAGCPSEIKKYSYTAIASVLFLMTLFSLIFAAFPNQVIAAFTSDKAAAAIAVPLMSILAAYQIFDGLQCVTGGILKGFQMTKTVSLCVLSSYWLIGAPIAYVLVSKYSMSLRGYWLALAFSLFFMGLIQSLIAKKRYQKFENSLYHAGMPARS